MKQELFSILLGSALLATSGFAATQTAGADKPVDWTDPATGWHYMYLPTPRTFIHAQAACANRGWSLFNITYLSKEEQDHFYASPVYPAIPWTTRFAGEPGEIQEAGYWNSSEMSGAGSSATATMLKIMKVEGKTRSKIDYYDAGKPDDGLKLTTICMYRGKTWFNCSIVQHCTLYGWTTTPGQPRYEYPEGTLDSTYSESGETEEEAMKQLVAKTNYKTPMEWKIHKVCVADKETFQCVQEH